MILINRPAGVRISAYTYYPFLHYKLVVINKRFFTYENINKIALNNDSELKFEKSKGERNPHRSFIIKQTFTIITSHILTATETLRTRLARCAYEISLIKAE